MGDVFVENVFLLYSYFQNDPKYIVFFFVCCLFICLLAVFSKKPDVSPFFQIRNKLVFPSFLLTILVFNPFSASLLISKVMMASRFFRFSWILPVLIVIALAMVGVIQTLPFKPVKIFVAALAPILFVGVNFQLGSFLDEYWTNDTPNWYKIPECVIDLCDYIENDSTFDEKTVIMPSLLSAWVRQYQSDIVMPYSANHYDFYISNTVDYFPLYSATNSSGTYDLSLVGALASSYPFNYVVIPAYLSTTGSLESSGYEFVYTINDKYLQTEDEDYSRLGAYHMQYYLYRRKVKS